MKINDFEATVAKLKPYLPEYLKEQGIDPTSKFPCPFPDHEDKDPSVSIVGLNSSSPRAYCFGCSKSMDIFDAVQLFENKPATGIEWVEDTLKYLAEKYGVEISTKDLTEEEIYELDTYRAYRAAASLIRAANLQGDEFKDFQQGVKARGWNAKTLGKYNVGTVSSFANFRDALKKAGFTAKFIDEIDLGRKDIFHPGNLIFTWKDEKGRPIGFTARNLKYEEEKEAAEKQGKKYTGTKYNNQRTTGLKCNIFQKGKRLYGINTAIKATPPLFIFEGQADVVTARHHGLLNCVAIAGSTLSQDHVHLLKKLGVYDIIVCLDGDETGRKKIQEILDRFAGHRDMRVQVIELPEGDDPDSFIRDHGAGDFKQLARWSAFEWRLNQYEESSDPSVICSEMIPYIVNEASAVRREELCKVLAGSTGVSLKAIREDLGAILDEKSRTRSRERHQIIEKLTYELGKSPSDAEQLLLVARTELQESNKKYDTDSLSQESFISAIDNQKEREEKVDLSEAGFELGPDLSPLREYLRGECSKDVFLAFGGKSNVGKSALMTKLAYCLAEYNEDVVSIVHTIDDTSEQLLPRLVCIAVGDHKLTINQVRQPKYWQDKVSNLYERREKGYKKVRELALSGKLIVKDANNGSSLSFTEGLISYYQELYPERKIVYILDNFHKLSDFPGKDERVRFKHLSEAIKAIATRLHVPIFSTVEYTKLPPGVKPSKTNIAESVAMEYDTNFIGHLYSELTDTPQNFTVCHKDTNWQGEQVLLPRVEMYVDKNKITECKGHIYFDFWPASSDYKWIAQETVASDSKKMKEEQQQNVDDGWGKK